jgi:hypothetical protein
MNANHANTFAKYDKRARALRAQAFASFFARLAAMFTRHESGPRLAARPVS